MAKSYTNKYKNKRQESGQAPFAVVEAYKSIRTNLLFSLSQDNENIVCISSSIPGEGKSSCAVNLAIAFSQLNNKVLLIDADLRRPSVYRKLKLQNNNGLSSVLVGFCNLADATQHINPNFDVLTSGPIPPNPAELLESENMKKLLISLSKIYNYIIIDTPPINVVTDAMVIAKQTSGIVLVAKNRDTTHEQLNKAFEIISFSNIRLLGVVLNDSSYTPSKYDKYKGYRY